MGEASEVRASPGSSSPEKPGANNSAVAVGTEVWGNNHIERLLPFLFIYSTIAFIFFLIF